MLSDDTLRVRLRLEPKFHNLSRIAAPTRKMAASELLGTQLGGLLDSPVQSDVTLVAGGREFRAHWNILSCRSKFFERMLQAGMSEAQSERVEIPDLDPVTMSAFLQFLYTGAVREELCVSGPVGTWFYNDGNAHYMITETCGELTWSEPYNPQHDKKVGLKTTGKLQEVAPNSWSAQLNNGDKVDLSLRSGKMEAAYHRANENSPNLTAAYCPSVVLEFWGRLLNAADKYCIPDLSCLCEDAMKQHFDVQNAAIILRIADEINRRDLKDAALRFITSSESQMRAVQQASPFDALSPELVKEVYEIYFNPRRLQKRARSDAFEGEPEFPHGSDWAHLSGAQLRRACSERDLPTGGGRSALVALLESQESRNEPVAAA